MTRQTLTTKSAVRAEIQRVRQQGWALDNQENDVEGRSIGPPILGPDGNVAAALSVSGPVFRMDIGRARSLVPELKKHLRRDFAWGEGVRGACAPAVRKGG